MLKKKTESMSLYQRPDAMDFALFANLLTSNHLEIDVCATD